MIDKTRVIVRLQDARHFQNGCKEGWKTFVELHGYNFKEVVLNGLTAQQLIDTGDQMAIDLANAVIDRDYPNV